MEDFGPDWVSGFRGPGIVKDLPFSVDLGTDTFEIETVLRMTGSGQYWFDLHLVDDDGVAPIGLGYTGGELLARAGQSNIVAHEYAWPMAPTRLKLVRNSNGLDVILNGRLEHHLSADWVPTGHVSCVKITMTRLPESTANMYVSSVRVWKARASTEAIPF